MGAKRLTKRGARDAANLGAGLLKAGDAENAHKLLSEALRTNARDAGTLFNLGLACERMGDADGAALHMSEALALAPKEAAFAASFSSLARRAAISNSASLSKPGLKAALSFDAVDRQAISELALAHSMSLPGFADALERVRAGHSQQAATALLMPRTASVLGDDLFLATLGAGKNTDPDAELLLTALRRALLLEVPADQLAEDRALFAFLLALAGQCTENDHVWAETPEENASLDRLSIDAERLASGDAGEGRKLALELLYRPFRETAARQIPASALERIRPKSLGAFVAGLARAWEKEHELARAIPGYGQIEDDVSARVAGQYEAAPYPRWSSLHASRPGSLRAALGRLVGKERLLFMDRPFDVLVAGCGTGQQAALAATGYGENASITALDISLPSLGYARRMCAALGLRDIAFAHADIRNVKLMKRRFDVIECVGVLHHMADPFAGWECLLDVLKPDGLMYVGLYSALSRENIAALRCDPSYPGPGCPNRAARKFRAELLSRAPGEPGAELRSSADFYSLNEFRDLVLHESEQHVTLKQVDGFLARNRLVFRGFTLAHDAIESYVAAFPGDEMPGTLEHWAALENRQRNLFDGMYRFWCSRQS